MKSQPYTSLSFLPSFIIVLALSLLSNFVLSCGDETSSANTSANNLLQNSSFERNGQPDFSGWTGQGYIIVNEAPQGGGNHSLELEPLWIPSEGYAENSVTGYKGKYTITLQWMARVQNWHGTMRLYKKSVGDSLRLLASSQFTNGGWESYSASALTTLQASDSIVVHFSAGSTEVSMGRVFIDMVELHLDATP